MKLIVLTGEAKSGKTHALELLKKVNDGTIEYFEDDMINCMAIPELLKRKERLGVVVVPSYNQRVNHVSAADFISPHDIFVISKEIGKYYLHSYLDPGEKLNWTEAFNWLRYNSTAEEKPKIVDEFFSYIVSRNPSIVIKKYGVDFHSGGGALTLSPEYVGCWEVGEHTKTHDYGWTITGEVVEDYYYWVNKFSAEHPKLGKVWGDFEDEVFADSEEGFNDFYSNFPPEDWDYGDI